MNSREPSHCSEIDTYIDHDYDRTKSGKQQQLSKNDLYEDSWDEFFPKRMDYYQSSNGLNSSNDFNSTHALKHTNSLMVLSNSKTFDKTPVKAAPDMNALLAKSKHPLLKMEDSRDELSFTNDRPYEWPDGSDPYIAAGIDSPSSYECITRPNKWMLKTKRIKKAVFKLGIDANPNSVEFQRERIDFYKVHQMIATGNFHFPFQNHVLT